ncbi:MAG: hypothetical protein JWP27_2355 [Flaviaesturariibacter sp.]|nr:hypothetical protein [Flaviaesturariibacter sp.]
MKRDYTNDELEDFLKRSSDRLQMRPSEQAWSRLSSRLNKRRRRMAWMTTSFLVVSSLVGYFLSQNTERLQHTTASLPSQERPGSRPVNGAQTSSPVEGTGEAAGTAVQSLSSSTAATENRRHTSRTHSLNPLRIAYRQPAAPQVADELLTEPSVTQTAIETVQAAAPPDFPISIVDSDPAGTSEAAAIADERTVTDELTIESVTNLFQQMRRQSKLSVEFFMTPTVSYRKLTENKSYMSSVPQSNATPNYAALYDINDAVTHKPNIGLELGVAAKYPVAENVRIQGGLQFNVNRYDIKAFSNYNNTPAPLAFSNGSTGVRATTYSNFSGANSDWLHNLYFQVSAPIGVEVKFGKSEHTQFGIASTVQPTYMLGDRVYLISSDYKNYVEVPWLVRRWNVNTALETFVSYSTKKVNWQVGPQVRYQLLSSFVDHYPVKEHLFDFGLKVGISLNKKTSTSDSNQ